MGQVLEQFGQSADIITLHNAATSFTTPTSAATGADVSRWQQGNAGPAAVKLSLSANGPTVIPGPLAIWATDADGTVEDVGIVNDGADIIIPNAAVSLAFWCNVGAASKLQLAPPADASNLTGRTATPTNGATVTVKAAPIRVVS